MKKVDPRRTNQLAIDACRDIKDQIRRNETRDKNKKQQSKSASSSSSCPSKKKKSDSNLVANDPAIPSDTGSGNDVAAPSTSQKPMANSKNSTSTVQNINYKRHFISDELFNDEEQNDQDGQEELSRKKSILTDEEDNDDDDDLNNLFENSTKVNEHDDDDEDLFETNEVYQSPTYVLKNNSINLMMMMMMNIVMEKI